MINIADFFYFRTVNKWMVEEIDILCDRILGNTTHLVSSLALVMITLWVFYQGFRILTGASREPAMVVVSHMVKISLIVSIACSMAIANDPVRAFLTTRLSNLVNCVVNNEVTSCSSTSIADKIDKNLAYMQIAMAAIDAVQVPSGDPATNDAKSRTMLIATLGTASPSMTAGAMLLLYQIAMALLIGLAPLFIMCLMFDQTKQLFHRWLMFTVSTVFSMAALSAMVSIAMKASINTAVALWVSQGIAHLTTMDTEGFTSQAMQQGGIGLLMTVLIISTPPLAGMLFNGTLGQFSPYSQVGAGGGMAGGYAGGMPAHGQGGWPALPGRLSSPMSNPAQVSSSGQAGVSLSSPVRGVPPSNGAQNGDYTKRF